MSNPGVIVLDTSELNARKINDSRLQIEDNIGEAIHIHLGDLRLDFTISDFLILADGLKCALSNLLMDLGINLDFLDTAFVREIEEHLLYLKGYEIENIYLDELKCIEYMPKSLVGWKPLKIVDTTGFKYLIDEAQEKYKDDINEYFIQENDGYTINALKLSIEKNGYPYNNKHIVLLGNELLIRDGKKRAAVLRYLYGNIKVPILILKFEKSYRKYKTKNRINIKEFGKHYLKLILPIKIRRALKSIVRG